MAAKSKTTFVPLHTIIVTRDDKQIDTLAEYKRTGKAFEFTQAEVDDITAGVEGNIGLALREPSDEGVDEAPVAAGAQAAADSPQAASKPAPKPKDADL